MNDSTHNPYPMRINLITSCTDRKSLDVLYTVGSITETSTERRMKHWVGMLRGAAERRSAIDLYQGEHWKIARRIYTSGRASLWVASAGYGLVHSETQLAGYSATFTHPSPDDVTGQMGTSEERRKWWNLLRQNCENAAPRMREIGSSGPIMLAASAGYIDAMNDEIIDAISNGVEVVIVTSNGLDDRLQSRQVLVEGRFRNVLGGSMQALNVRVAEHIINSLDGMQVSLESARAVVADLASKSPPLKKYSRRTMSDEEVRSFVAEELKSNTRVSKSALLRKLRDQGYACEQTRFSALFSEVKTLSGEVR